jgi:hypothetical protein
MDAASIAKEFIGLQKQSFNNLIDTMIIFQDQAEKTNRLLTSQMGVSEKGQDFVQQWRTTFKQMQDSYRELINESFTKMEGYFANCEQKKPSKGK